MAFFQLFKPRLALPRPKLRLVIFGSEEKLPWPLQLVHPAGLWGALVGVPSIANRSHDIPLLWLEQPMEEGDYVFEGLHGTVIACVQRREKGCHYPRFDSSLDVHRNLGINHEEYEQLEDAQWMVALELTEVLDQVGDAVLFQMELADRLALLSGGIVLDQEARRYYLPGGWRVPNASRPLDAREHITLHKAPDTEHTVWVHTHGLSKFSRFELEIHDLPETLSEPACRLLMDLSQFLVNGGVMQPGEKVGDPRSPLYLRLRENEARKHYSSPSLELVDVGEDGKPLESGGACGVAVHTLAWSKAV